jgi:hypothetical protein
VLFSSLGVHIRRHRRSLSRDMGGSVQPRSLTIQRYEAAKNVRRQQC